MSYGKGGFVAAKRSFANVENVEPRVIENLLLAVANETIRRSRCECTFYAVSTEAIY